MIKVLNNDSGKIEEIEDGGLPDLIDSGKVSILKGQELEFEDNDGQRRIVPSEQIFDALDAGFKHVPQKQVQNEELVKESADQPLLAAGVSGLSGLTLGLSNQILAKSGIVSPEKLKALEEGNPIISTASEIVGGVAPIFLTGGTGLAAKVAAATPVALAERAGMAAALKAAPLTGKILSKTASRVTKEVVENAVKYGAGSAVEGSLYGLGNLINEDALGDAEFNAENALAAMGSNALLGGAFGAGAGAGVAMIGAGARGIKQQYNSLRKKAADIIDDPELKQQINAKITLDSQVDDFFKKKGVDTDELADRIELERAAERTGVTLTPGMLEGGLKAELEGSLAKSKSIFGDMTKKEVGKTYEGLEQIKDVMLKDAADVDPMTLGSRAKEGISAKITEELEPAKYLYEDLKPIFQQTKVPEPELLSYILELGEDFLNRVTGDGETWLRKLSRVETIDDVSKLRSLVGSDLRTYGLKATEKSYLGELYDKMTKLRNDAIEQNLKGKPFISKGVQVQDTKDALQLADSIYKTTHDKYDFLKKHLGIKSNNMDELMNKLDELSEKDISDKILNLRNPKMADQFQTYFPEIYDLARARRLQEIANKSTTKGQFSPATFYSNVKKLDQNDLKILFPHIKDPKQLLKDYETIINKLPPLTNPSGTAYELALQGMFTLPYQAKEALRYAVYKSGPNSVVNQLTNMIPLTGSIEKAANKGKKSISDAVDAFYKKSSDLSIKSINRIITGQDLGEKEIKTIEEKMELYQQSPEELVNNFTKNNKQLYGAAPKTSEALQGKIMNAAQFLSSKIPKKQVTPFDDGTISRSELLKFKNYVDAVEDPYKVLDTIKAGYVAPEYMEAFSAVYPKMAEAVKEEFTARLPEFKNLTEKQKADLTKILGIDARKAYSPIGFQTLQGISSQGVQKDLSNNVPKQSKVSVSGAKNIGQSNRAQSGLDRVLYRK
jgi:hypothetical protein